MFRRFQQCEDTKSQHVLERQHYRIIFQYLTARNDAINDNMSLAFLTTLEELDDLLPEDLVAGHPIVPGDGEDDGDEGDEGDEGDAAAEGALIAAIRGRGRGRVQRARGNRGRAGGRGRGAAAALAHAQQQAQDIHQHGIGAQAPPGDDDEGFGAVE
jgi:hypothetical protein